LAISSTEQPRFSLHVYRQPSFCPGTSGTIFSGASAMEGTLFTQD
jgi:hypothetical protein